MYFDTHCHLNDDEFADDVDGYLSRAKAAGVDYFLVVGWDDKSSLKAVEMAEKYPQVFACVGFHPTEIAKVPEDRFAVIKRLLNHPKVVALGEIGLDFCWQKTDEEHRNQEKYFIRQIELANKFGKPVVIHSRDAAQETLRILTQNQPQFGGVMHCYSGSPEMAVSFMNLGLLIALGGPVTFKNARVSKDVALKTPLNQLLIETDSPYLTPHPHRGERNESSFLPLVAAAIGDIKGIDAEDVGEWTTRNALRLFHVKQL
jgi:TatD DNase family protein